MSCSFLLFDVLADGILPYRTLFSASNAVSVSLNSSVICSETENSVSFLNLNLSERVSWSLPDWITNEELSARLYPVKKQPNYTCEMSNCNRIHQ